MQNEKLFELYLIFLSKTEGQNLIFLSKTGSINMTFNEMAFANAETAFNVFAKNTDQPVYFRPEK